MLDLVIFYMLDVMILYARCGLLFMLDVDVDDFVRCSKIVVNYTSMWMLIMLVKQYVVIENLVF